MERMPRGETRVVWWEAWWIWGPAWSSGSSPPPPFQSGTGQGGEFKRESRGGSARRGATAREEEKNRLFSLIVSDAFPTTSRLPCLDPTAPGESEREEEGGEEEDEGGDEVVLRPPTPVGKACTAREGGVEARRKEEGQGVPTWRSASREGGEKGFPGGRRSGKEEEAWEVEEEEGLAEEEMKRADADMDDLLPSFPVHASGQGEDWEEEEEEEGEAGGGEEGGKEGQLLLPRMDRLPEASKALGNVRLPILGTCRIPSYCCRDLAFWPGCFLFPFSSLDSFLPRFLPFPLSPPQIERRR